MNVKHVLQMTLREWKRLEKIVKTGKSAAWKTQRAHALLKMDRDEHGPAWNDAQIAPAFGMTTRNLESWRRQVVEGRPESLLERHYGPRPHTYKLDGEGEA